MKWNRRSVLELATIVAMIVIVVVLATVQYQWVGEISRSEQTRLKSALSAGIRSFNQDFPYAFEQLCENFEIPPQTSDSEAEAVLIRRHVAWTRSAVQPGLLASLSVSTFSGARAHVLESFDPQSQRFIQVAWPPRLEPLQTWLSESSQRLSPSISDRQAVYYPWTFYAHPPVLIRPIFQNSLVAPNSNSSVSATAFLVVELGEDYLKTIYFPGLLDRDFGRLGFDVAIRSGLAPYEKIYASRPDFPIAIASPDASLSIFDSVGEEARRRGRPSVQIADASAGWQLVLQHPSGSLDVAAASWRRRNLAISLGLLAILVATLVLIFSGAHRAEHFAKLQVDFVAGVSHEICTPLAVINAAVENLADGVVDDPEKIAEYAGILREQGARLERSLDQMFSFAARKFSGSDFDVHPVDIVPIVAQSITISEPLLRDAGFALEATVQSELPLVNANPDAVDKCLENLISNAVKYGSGGSGNLIRLQTRLGWHRSHPEVQISVEDKGSGIPANDLKQVFEPFYRVQTAREGQTRGVGLGLFLIKQMMEAMGGRVTVSSELGRGTCFVLHFPVLNSAKSPQSVRA